MSFGILFRHGASSSGTKVSLSFQADVKKNATDLFFYVPAWHFMLTHKISCRIVSLAIRTSESWRPARTLPEEGNHTVMNAAHKLSDLPLSGDRHPEDIKAAVRKSGWTFTQLGPRFGYGRKSIDRALYRPWPAVERLISAVVGEAPWVLWPSRYGRLSEANRTSILAGIERLRLRLAQEPSRIRPI